MKNIKVLIVIYNKSIEDCITISAIKDIKNLDVYIADNSTKKYGNQGIAKKYGYDYTNMNGNQGLSKAYNKVIAGLKKDDDVICLFDDDTIVDNKYFTVLKEDVAKYRHINLFAPVVEDEKGILSPCIIKGATGKRLDSVEHIPKAGVSFINSGLAIRLKVFEDYRYDEGFFLDYIDHAFIKDIINNDASKIRVMDTVVKQRFAQSEKLGKEVDLKRYNIFRKDISYFCKKYGVSNLDLQKILLKRKCSIFLKYL